MKSIEVVAALIEQGNSFLACQRPAHKARALLWEFPGGKVEPGETKAQAIVRECREELGVELGVCGEYMDVTHEYPDLTVHLTLMRCRIVSGCVTLLEHADARFVTIDEAQALPYCPADQVFLREIRKRITEDRHMNHAEKARMLFTDGYNCAQAVVGAFADEIGLPMETLMKLTSSFGGGMGGLRDTCGAVTGMFMVTGLLFGYDRPGDDAVKKAHYARIRSLADSFKAKHESIICHELLAATPGKLQRDPLPRTPEYYKVRPCVRFVEDAARLVEQMLCERQAEV